MTLYHKLIPILSLFSIILIQSCNEEENNNTSETFTYLDSYEVKSNYSYENLILLAQIGGLSEIIPLIEYGFESYRITYHSTDKNNQPIILSGVVSFPNENISSDWVIINRGTTLSEASAPSISNNPTYEFGASLGYNIIIPDLVGFGSTADSNQYYYIKEKTGEHIHSMLLAASELANLFHKENTSNCYITGYSQGGYSTLAAMQHFQKINSNFSINEIHVGAGGYDLVHIMDQILSEETYGSPSFLALITYAYYHYYEWEIPLNEIFREDVIEDLPLVLEGMSSIEQANSILPNTLDSLFNPIFMDELINHDTKNLMYNALLQNSVTTFDFNNEINLYHSPNDELIPYSSTVQLFNNLLNKNINVNKFDVEGESHSDASVPMLMDAFFNISN